MRVLVTDSFCSSNRGDAAILDGILSGLRARGAEVEVVSHFPAVAMHFHGVTAIDDRDPVEVARAMRRASLVVSCGGSFLHDLYAGDLNPRLATFHLAHRLGVPFAIFAQSLGPFGSPLSRAAAREVLDRAAWICVRDPWSAEEVRRLGVAAPIHVGVDAAILGASDDAPREAGPVLGVTARRWHFPGCADPAAAQERYESDLASACDAWASTTGGRVRFLSNCTSFGGYRQDDRVTARAVAARMRARTEVVEADDLSFSKVRGMAAACDFFLGTRMHSLIFATCAGVPAYGIAYEQKTSEWMTGLGLGENVSPIESTADLPARLLAAWAGRHDAARAVAAALPALRERAADQLDRLVAVARGARPARASVSAAARPGWDGETWRYDLAHRRLRCVADAVHAEGGKRVLDLGCSTGMLGRMLGPLYDYSGIDAAPSVARVEPGFAIRVGSADSADLGGPYDTAVCSGVLEYASDIPGVLARLRASLVDGGLAVMTLFNLAHVARAGGGAHRHRDWVFEQRPDDFVLAIHEAGFDVTRVLASSAGYAPPAAVSDERPTDFDRDGGGPLPPERMTRLAHHWVVLARAGAPRAGASAIPQALEAGDVRRGLEIGVSLIRAFPWAARAWSDLGVAWHVAGNATKARECLERAVRLDPGRTDARENLAAIGGQVGDVDVETAWLLSPGDPACREALVRELLARGRVHGAAVVAAGTGREARRAG